MITGTVRLPWGGGGGGSVCADERVQRRREIRRRAGDAIALCAWLDEREVVGTATDRNANADPRFFFFFIACARECMSEGGERERRGVYTYPVGARSTLRVRRD